MAKEEKKQAEEAQDIEQEVRQEEPQPSKKELRKEQKRIEELEKKVEEDLIAEVQRLRAENAYLKKLNALVSERVRQEKKHKWSGNWGMNSR